MRKHITDIRDKYIVPGETAESALLFLPSEAIYAELHANFAGVVDESYRARVWIVSPTTMMATLNTVRAVLKDVQMREQAGEIQKMVGADDGRRAAAARAGRQPQEALRADREGPARDRHLERRRSCGAASASSSVDLGEQPDGRCCRRFNFDTVILRSGRRPRLEEWPAN